MDTCNKWLQATVIDKKLIGNNAHFKVSYVDFSNKYDEWIERGSNRI